MLLTTVQRNVQHSRCLSTLHVCCAQAKQQDTPIQHYGYVCTDDGSEKRDKQSKGVVHIGKVNLPTALKDSLKLFYNRFPHKMIIADGLKLSRHISNRGRPTHTTWLKYKEEVDSLERRRTGKKATDRNQVKQFSFEEAVEAGLLSGEFMDGEHSEDGKESDGNVHTVQTTCETETDLPVENTSDTDVLKESKKASRKKEGKIKRPQMTSYSMIRYGTRETAAYMASQVPAVYGSTYKALSEIKKGDPAYEPKTLLDFGSGTGMSVWAANSVWKDSIGEYQCVDASEHMNNAAEFLLRGSSDITRPVKIPNVYFKRFLPLSNNIKYDVVIAAYTLTEMPFHKQRLQAIQSLWRKTNDFLVIIEPGNNEGFETALQARRYISQSDKTTENEYGCFEDAFGDYNLDTGKEDIGHIFAPCTHELVCARTDVNTRDHPCNFTQKVELSFAHWATPLKKLSYYNERFSYIILRKGPPDKSNDKVSWARILEPVKARKKHVICELCCHNGNIEKHVITKGKDKHLYKAARHVLKWGDMMPLDEAKRPMNIRTSVGICDSK